VKLLVRSQVFCCNETPESIFQKQKYTWTIFYLTFFPDHCFVPHKYPENPKLSQWVRKQRHQRKRKERGLHSTLSDEREQILTNAGFIWDSHRAQWHERYQSLEIFHMTNGHCNVPSNYHDSSLSNWVKNQRKQYKLYRSGKLTAMDEERIDLLNSLSFNWDPRNLSPNL